MRDDTIRDGLATEAPMRAPDESRPSSAGERSAFRFEDRHERARPPAEDRLELRHEDRSLASLVKDLVHQGSRLAEQQTKLVEAEVRSATTDLKESVGAMGGAAVVGIAGLGVLLMGISFLLGTVMPLWLATMIVAVATLAGAYTMFAAGKSKLKSKSLTLDRTRQTIERAPAAMTGHEKEMHNGR